MTLPILPFAPHEYYSRTLENAKFNIVIRFKTILFNFQQFKSRNFM